MAIVTTNHAPEIRFEGFSRSKGEGATDAMSEVLNAVFSGYGREVGIILLPITLPASAVIGAAVAPSADKVKSAEKEWARDLENLTLADYLHDQIIVAGIENGVKWQPVSQDLKQQIIKTDNYKMLAKSGIDTVLELAITKISANGDDLDAPLLLQMQAHARLLRTEDNTEIFSSDAEYWGNRYTRTEWAADKSKLLLQDLTKGCNAISKQIIENVFMLYPFPDQNWHSSFPRGTLGLATIDPPPGGFLLARVKNYSPALCWEAFPRESDIKVAQEDMSRVKNVRYDLFIASTHGNDLKIIYYREGISNSEHKIEIFLDSGAEYKWSVRARFELDGRERVTEWSGLALGLSPKFDRRFVPPYCNSYFFKTP